MYVHVWGLFCVHVKILAFRPSVLFSFYCAESSYIWWRGWEEMTKSTEMHYIVTFVFLDRFWCSDGDRVTGPVLSHSVF